MSNVHLIGRLAQTLFLPLRPSIPPTFSSSTRICSLLRCVARRSNLLCRSSMRSSSCFWSSAFLRCSISARRFDVLSLGRFKFPRSAPNRRLLRCFSSGPPLLFRNSFAGGVSSAFGGFVWPSVFEFVS